MPINPVENLWHTAQLPDGTGKGAQVTRAEADAIVVAIKHNGIHPTELAVVEKIIEGLQDTSTTAEADSVLSQVDNAWSGRDMIKGAARRTPTAGEVLAMIPEKEGLDADQSQTTRDAAHQAHLLGQATYIRHQLEIARRVPVITDELSRLRLWDVFVIRDSEARRALSAITAAGPYAGVVSDHISHLSGGKYIKRLVDNLPEAQLKQLRNLVNQQDADVKKTVETALGSSLWDDLQGR